MESIEQHFSKFQSPRIFTARKRSCGKVMFLHPSVSHSVHRGGLCMMSLLSGWLVPCSFQGVSVSGPMFLLGVCLWSHVPCGVSVWGSLSGGGGFCPGSLCQGDSPGQKPPRERPHLLFGKERAVHILLECIFV